MKKQTEKTIEQKYQKLDEVTHVLKRPGRYIGSTKPHESEEWIPDEPTKKMEKRVVTYNPGFLKLFDEVISNSADFSKTAEGKHVDTIRVEVEVATGEISVFDNGGIPVVFHKEANQYVPEMIFELRAGSNFDDSDESVLTGQNGEGAGLTNIFSTKFTVDTCDGKNKFKMVFAENSQARGTPDVTPAKANEKGYTRITYMPDYEKLGMYRNTEFGLDNDNYNMLYARVVEVAATNTNLKVYWNGERVLIRNFKDYIEMFGDADFDYAYEETPNFRVGVAASEDGFEHVSFVNTTRTKIGGTHILYVGMQIWEALREFIKKKHKVDVPPAQLRQHVTLFLDATIVNPRYSSQTKDDLITEPKEYRTTYTPSDKFIAKILKSSIIQNILDAAEAKALMEKNRALRESLKDADKMDPRRVEKFTDALEKKRRGECILFLSEGDCLERSTQILVYRDNELKNIPLTEVAIGDRVLTHENRLRKVLGRTEKVSDSIKIKFGSEELIVSPSHRLIVYDIESNQFIEKSAAELDKTKHKLIKSRIIQIDHLSDLISVTPSNDKLEIIFEDEIDEPTIATLDHKFFVWDKLNGQFILEMSKNLEVGRHMMVMAKE